MHYVDGYAVDNTALAGIWDRLPAEQVYERYVGLLCGAAESGIFDIPGHLDVPKTFPCFETTLRRALVELSGRLL